MRFKTGLCLKLCLGAATLLGCSLLLLKENDGTDFSAAAAGAGAGERAGADTEQRRNETKPPPGEVAEGGGGEGDMVDPSDSLAGNRIEGLPNVTESRWIFWNDFILFPKERDVRKKCFDVDL